MLSTYVGHVPLSLSLSFSFSVCLTVFPVDEILLSFSLYIVFDVLMMDLFIVILIGSNIRDLKILNVLSKSSRLLL